MTAFIFFIFIALLMAAIAALLFALLGASAVAIVGAAAGTFITVLTLGMTSYHFLNPRN